MRKIKSLMELDFSPLLSTEAISTKGGGEWRYADGAWSYWLDEVTVTADKPGFDINKDVPLLQDPSFFEFQQGNPILGPIITGIAIAGAYIGYLTR
jgi:hypothetical protein